MGDQPAQRTPLEQAIADDPDIRDAILGMARKRLRNEADAEDFSQNAITLAIVRSRETGEPPPPPSVRRFVLFIGGFLTNRAFNMRRANKRHPQANVDVYDPKTIAASSKDAEAVLAEHHRERLLLRIEKELVEHLKTEEEKDRRISLGILEWCQKEGVHKTEDLAARLRCKPDEVLNARRRISQHGARIRQRILAEEGVAAA